MVVGSHLDDAGAADAGSAYVFDATSGVLLRTLTNPTPAGSDNFGYSVAVSGTVVLVGAYHDDSGATDAGSAYVFDAASGTLLRTLANPTTPADGDKFGNSVAVSGNAILVGAFRDSSGAAAAGAAYAFDVTTGMLLQTLTRPTPTDYGYFGCSVAVSGSTMLVGMSGDDTGAESGGVGLCLYWRTAADPHQPHAGRLRLFRPFRGGLGGQDCCRSVPERHGRHRCGIGPCLRCQHRVLLWTLANPTPAIYDSFGYSVAISGNTMVIGAYQDDTGATDAGAAYVFDATSGTLLQTLVNPTPAASDWFGYSVAISGNIVVVGMHLDDTGATDTGAAYIFDASTGALLKTLTNPASAAGDNFGVSVAVSGDNVVVGAEFNDTGATDAGAAYIFDTTSGVLLQTLTNPTPAGWDLFGVSVAVAGNTVVVGRNSTTQGHRIPERPTSLTRTPAHY